MYDALAVVFASSAACGHVMMVVAPASVTVPPPALTTVHVEGKLSASQASPNATALVVATCTPTRLSGGTPCGVTPLPDSARVNVAVGARMSRATVADAVGATAGGGGLPDAVTATVSVPGLALEDTSTSSVLVAVPPPGAGERLAGEKDVVTFGSTAAADSVTASAAVPSLVTVIV